jgi:site-specific recombinase XerC
VHRLSATRATNALEARGGFSDVQEWLGHANIATTRIYDHLRHWLDDSPTFKVTS